jgi:hypothetical protein
MDAPISAMVDDSGSNLDQPPDDRVHRWLDSLAPECTALACARHVFSHAEGYFVNMRKRRLVSHGVVLEKVHPDTDPHHSIPSIGAGTRTAVLVRT